MSSEYNTSQLQCKEDFVSILIFFNAISAYNPGLNTLELYNVLIQMQFTTSKGNLISSIANLIYELPHELLNDLRLRRILGNEEMLERSQIWMDT